MPDGLKNIFLALASMCFASPVAAQSFEPVEDLQWLAIENIVGPVIRSDSPHIEQVRDLTERARELLLQGRYGEARRLNSQARALLHGAQWNADTEFLASLALRPSRVAVDAERGLVLAIGQHFSSSAPASDFRNVRLRLAARPLGKPSATIVSLGEIQLPTPDLIEQPAYTRIDTKTLADGSWRLEVQVTGTGRDIAGKASTRIHVARDLDADLEKLRDGVARLQVRPSLAASIAYPVNLTETLDLRARRVVDVDLRAELDAALALLDEASNGKDPLWQARGLTDRHYRSHVSGRIEPYRLFIPHDWDGKTTMPLVVMLHGSMGDERSAFASGELEKLATERGIAVLSPMGDDPNSVWGNRLPVVLGDGTLPSPRPVISGGRVQPVEQLELEPAEADVAATLHLVRSEYPIDAGRIYLAGNSMGGEGAWHLAALWPGIWAAIAPGAGPIAPDLMDYAALSQVPALIVHGRRDPITSFEASGRIADRLRDAGGEVKLLAPEAGHDAFGRNLTQVLDFLLSHTKDRARGPGE